MAVANSLLLVLLGSVLALASLEEDYIQITRQLDNEAIQKYFITTDPLSLEIQWDQFLGRALLILEKGKQKAVERVSRLDLWQIEHVKKEWNSVQEQGVNGQLEVRQIIDNLRLQALVKAPSEWSQAAQLSMHLFETFKKAAAEANPEAVRRALTLCRDSFRQIYVDLNKLFAHKHHEHQHHSHHNSHHNLHHEHQKLIY